MIVLQHICIYAVQAFAQHMLQAKIFPTAFPPDHHCHGVTSPIGVALALVGASVIDALNLKAHPAQDCMESVSLQPADTLQRLM